jgi:putative ABC transport system permease protein
MNLSAVLSIALRTLARNKMRTALTMLGITIGIAAVICTVAIGQAGQVKIQESLANLGDNLVWIEAGSRNVQGVRTGTGNSTTLKYGDMEAILQSVPLIKAASPQVDARIQVVYGNQNWNTGYRGIAPEYLEVRRWSVARGTIFTHDDVDNYANVAVLAATVANILFPDDDPIGKTIRLRDTPFKVMGVLNPKGYSATGQDQDDFVLIPYTTAQHKVKGVDYYDDIMCSAISPLAISPAIDQVTSLLRQRHRLRPDQADDFNIRRPEEFLQQLEATNRTFTLLLGSVASVSLLVGGIGVMNIMLVSVTERTREIGVRMAVGATERDVRLQFLSEAVVLSLLGGAFGVLGGWLGAKGISSILDWRTFISPQAILAAAVFSVGVGIFFGYYPARKAAALDPIEALRYE